MKGYKPRISEAEAKGLLTLRGRIFRSRKTVPYRVELIYLPYYFFQIRVKNKKGEEREFCAAIDAILGSFSMVEKEAMLEQELSEAEFQPKISLEEATSALEKEVRWFLVSRSMQKRERYQFLGAEPGELAWYPYWVGYYKNKSGAWEFLALDAISGILQGGPARRLFIHAFAETRIGEGRSSSLGF